jgi:hypothetical protein
VDRGVSRGQRGGSPTVVNLSFLDRIESATPDRNKNGGKLCIFVKLQLGFSPVAVVQQYNRQVTHITHKQSTNTIQKQKRNTNTQQ